MKKIEEVSFEIDKVNNELNNIRYKLNILFKQLSDLEKSKRLNNSYDEELYEKLCLSNKNLQVQRKQLMIKLDKLNKEFYRLYV